MKLQEYKARENVLIVCGEDAYHPDWRDVNIYHVCHYICDGIEDEVQILAAYEALKPDGGVVELCGWFYVSEGAYDRIYPPPEGVTQVGYGPCGVIEGEKPWAQAKLRWILQQEKTPTPWLGPIHGEPVHGV